MSYENSNLSKHEFNSICNWSTTVNDELEGKRCSTITLFDCRDKSKLTIGLRAQNQTGSTLT